MTQCEIQPEPDTMIQSGVLFENPTLSYYSRLPRAYEGPGQNFIPSLPPHTKKKKVKGYFILLQYFGEPKAWLGQFAPVIAPPPPPLLVSLPNSGAFAFILSPQLPPHGGPLAKIFHLNFKCLTNLEMPRVGMGRHEIDRHVNQCVSLLVSIDVVLKQY